MRGLRVTDSPLNQALRSTLAIMTKVGPDDLRAATPCASWDVRALVNHFVGSARWWAAVIAGQDAAADADYAAGDLVAAYEESIRLAAAAFAAEGALERTVRLPFGEFPGAVLRDLAATEQFVHGWDLARAIGYPARLTLSWRPSCSAGRGSWSPTRTAVRTGRPCSVPLSRPRPGPGRRPAGRLPREAGLAGPSASPLPHRG